MSDDIQKFLAHEHSKLLARKLELSQTIAAIDTELAALEAYQHAKGAALGLAEETISVPEAGAKYFNLSRNGAYMAASKGKIPSVKIGGRRRVPVAALERMFGQAAE